MKKGSSFSIQTQEQWHITLFVFKMQLIKMQISSKKQVQAPHYRPPCWLFYTMESLYIKSLCGWLFDFLSCICNNQWTHEITIQNFLTARWDEGDVSAFLDVQIQKDTSTKTVHLTQPGLIEQVLKDVGKHKLSTKKLTPADNILHPDPECTDCTETWNDWCMIGKLIILQIIPGQT